MMEPVKYSEILPSERADIRSTYVALQNGDCFYCGRSLDYGAPLEVMKKTIDWSLFPKGFLDHPVHLQHNHDTDLTEGAVHAYCNAVMWQYEGR